MEVGVDCVKWVPYEDDIALDLVGCLAPVDIQLVVFNQSVEHGPVFDDSVLLHFGKSWVHWVTRLEPSDVLSQELLQAVNEDVSSRAGNGRDHDLGRIDLRESDLPLQMSLGESVIELPALFDRLGNNQLIGIEREDALCLELNGNLLAESEHVPNPNDQIDLALAEEMSEKEQTAPLHHLECRVNWSRLLWNPKHFSGALDLGAKELKRGIQAWKCQIEMGVVFFQGSQLQISRSVIRLDLQPNRKRLGALDEEKKNQKQENTMGHCKLQVLGAPF